MTNIELHISYWTIRNLIEQNFIKHNGWYDTGLISDHKDAMEVLAEAYEKDPKEFPFPVTYRPTYGRGGTIRFDSPEPIDIQAVQTLLELPEPEPPAE